MKYFIVILSTILALSIIVIVSIFTTENEVDQRSEYKMLIFKFCLIIIIGGFISLFYRQYRHNKKNWQNQKERLHSLNMELIETYNRIKNNRRSLKSQARRAIDREECFRAKEYNNLLLELSQIQLKLEMNLKKLSTGFEFLSNRSDLIKQLKKVGHFLNLVLGEHEYAFRESKVFPEFIKASKIPHVTEYTNHLMSKAMHDKVYLPFRNALEEVNKLYEKHSTMRMI